MKAILINAMSTIGVVTALGLLIMSAAFFCNERGFHPLRRNAQRFRKMTKFEKLFLSVFVGAITVFASLKDNPTNSPPSNLRSGGLVENYSTPLRSDSNNDWSLDCDRVSAIDVSTNGVSLTLHRPETNALDTVEVTVAGSTNLVAATWEAYTNVVFAAGVTNVEVFISREMMAAHSVSNVNFFAFIQSGDSDGDGLDDWHERFNLKIDPYNADSDGDGVADGVEVAMGMNPNSRDTDGDGYGDAGDPDPLLSTSWEDLNGDGWPDAWLSHWFNGVLPSFNYYVEFGRNGLSFEAILLMGMDPAVPTNANFAVSGKCSPRTIQAYEILPHGFSFSRVDGDWTSRLTNVASRTVFINRTNPWQYYFLSSATGCAAGWCSSGVEIRVESSGANGMTFNPMPAQTDDSWRLQLRDVSVQSATVSVLATGQNPSLSGPLYLLAWSPEVLFYNVDSNALASALGPGGESGYAIRRFNSDGVFRFPFLIDFTTCPNKAGGDTGLLDDISHSPDAALSMDWTWESVYSDICWERRPSTFTVPAPVVVDMPVVGTNTPQRLYFYELEVSYADEVESGPRSSKWAPPYPLVTPSLRSAFHAAGEHGGGQIATVRILPDHPDVRLGLGLDATELVPELTISPGQVAVPYFNGVPDWDGRFALSNSVPERWPQVETGEGDEITSADDCGCGGLADELDQIRPRLRIPLGGPVAGESLGFEWFDLVDASHVGLDAVKLLVTSAVVCFTNEMTGRSPSPRRADGPRSPPTPSAASQSPSSTPLVAKRAAGRWMPKVEGRAPASGFATSPSPRRSIPSIRASARASMRSAASPVVAETVSRATSTNGGGTSRTARIRCAMDAFAPFPRTAARGRCTTTTSWDARPSAWSSSTAVPSPARTSRRPCLRNTSSGTAPRKSPSLPTSLWTAIRRTRTTAICRGGWRPMSAVDCTMRTGPGGSTSRCWSARRSGHMCASLMRTECRCVARSIPPDLARW